MTIRSKIIALNCVTAAITLLLGGSLAYRSYTEYRSLKEFSKVSSFLIEMIELTDQLTFESGGVWPTTTHHFPAEEVPEGIREYKSRIQTTNDKIDHIHTLTQSMDMENYSPRFQTAVSERLDLSDRLNTIRNRQLVDKADPWPTTQLYNKEIKHLLSLIPQIATETKDAELVRKTVVSDYVMQMQLLLDRHTGLLNYALDTGLVSETVHTQCKYFVDDVRPLLDRIRMVAETEALPKFASSIDNSDLAKVIKATQTVLDIGPVAPGSNETKSYDPALVDSTTQATAAVLKSFPNFRNYILDDIKSYTDNRTSTSRNKLFQSLALMILSLILCGGGGILVVKALVKSINAISDELQSSASKGIATAEFVAQSSSQLANGCSSQAASIEEINATMAEITSMSNHSWHRVSGVLRLAQQTNDSAISSAQSMDKMRTAMSNIQTSSNEIGNIAKEIEEIAFQTNILALNAAVEAARAGEAGAGFAVVADEVRSLAQKSAASASSTREKIENATASVKEGTTLSEEAEGQLSQIHQQIEEIKNALNEVETNASQQSTAVNQVSESIASIENVTQQNVDAAEESARASQEMDQQSQQIMGNIQNLERLVIGLQKQSSKSHSQQTSFGESDNHGWKQTPQPTNGFFIRKSPSNRPAKQSTGDLVFHQDEGDFDHDFENFSTR